MKKIVALATLRGQLTGILPLRLTNTNTSIANTGIPGNDVAISLGEANDSSASAQITTTMTRVCLPEKEFGTTDLAGTKATQPIGGERTSDV